MKCKIFQSLLIIVAIVLLSIGLKRQNILDNKVNQLGILITKNMMNSGQKPPQVVDVSVDDDFVVGADTAPVTIIMFSDYECSYCKMFFDETLPQISNEYIKAGLVKFVVRDYPIDEHYNAFFAAKLAECSKQQNKFLEMHELLIEKQQELSEDNYVDLIAKLNLDESQLNACLSGTEVEMEINKDVNDAREIGIRGTPTFIINNKMYVGTKPFDEFKALIDTEISK